MLQNHEQLKEVSYHLQNVYHLLLNLNVNHGYKLKGASVPELNCEELQP